MTYDAHQNAIGSYHDWIDHHRLEGLRSGEYQLTDYDREKGFDRSLKMEIGTVRVVHQAIAILANPNYVSGDTALLRGKTDATNDRIADVCGVPPDGVGRAIAQLLDSGVLVRGGNSRCRILRMTRGPSTIPIVMARNVDQTNTAASRKCLKCRREFESTWVGNRVCGSCKETREFRDAEWALI